MQLLEDTGFLAAKPASVPLDPSLKLTTDDGPILSDITAYRRLIGRLLYLILSRPDITFVVHMLSQFFAKPRLPPLQAFHALIRYLKSNPGQDLFFFASSSLQARAFSDTDWGSCSDSRRSTAGFCVFLGDSLVSKQNTVSHSSTEAEYHALAVTTSELIWIQQLLAVFGISRPAPAVLFCDNQAAIYLAHNPTFHERTKHIEIDYHFVRDCIANGSLKLLLVSARLQLADIFTKALPASSLFPLLSKMSVTNIYRPS